MSLILGSVLQRLKKAGFPKAEVPLIERVRQSQRDFYSKIEFKLLFDRGKQRRFLVFIQCSANSYNKALLSNRNRSFDLLLNFYDGVPDLRPEVEIACHQIGSKCTAISKITCESPDLLDRYEWVLFLDDDIELSTDQLNALFAEVDNSSLDAAQPALSHDSPGAWDALRETGLEGRTAVTNTIEIMMPCLSRRALKEAAWVFKESVSGYGVDLLLGAYLSRRFGIDTFVIGSVVATHQRPIDQRDGAFYKFLRSQRIDPLEELRVITKLFGLSLEIYRIRLL